MMNRSFILIPLCLLLGGIASATLWSWDGVSTWDPPSAVLGSQYQPSIPAIPITAEAQESPTQITLTLYSAPGGDAYDTNKSGTYDIYRKDPEALTWDASPVATVVLGTSVATWTDTNVVVGAKYEYGLYSQTRGDWVFGNVIAGIKADCTDAKGHMAVVVTDEVKARLPEEYAQYKADLVKDGWAVHEIVTPRAADYLSNGTGPNDADGIPTGPFPTNHIAIRDQLMDLYGVYSNELKNVVLIGKVQVARTGMYEQGPDGHGNRAAWAGDAYYADMDGIWTDLASNEPMIDGDYVSGFTNNPDFTVTLPESVKVPDSFVSTLQIYRSNGWSVTLSSSGYRFVLVDGDLVSIQGIQDSTISVSLGTVNIPGDNKFDAEGLDELTPNNRLELGFGRIDFSNQVAAEYESLRNYFNKLHRYKTAAEDFRPGRRAISRVGFGALTHGYLQAMPGVLGMTNLDFITTSDLPFDLGDRGDADSAYTAVNDPYLFYFKGSSTPDYSDGGRAVFWSGLQSSWGYWFWPVVTSSQNTMQRRLAEDNFALSYTWNIALYNMDTSYMYHRLGMGGTAGDMMRWSMSNRRADDQLYGSADTPLFMNHMGDPALRIYMFPSPTDLQVLPGSGNPQLSWTAAIALDGEPAVIGYHVYRSANAEGPFTRLTSSVVTGTSYTDSSVNSGEWHYQVKAVRLEPCGGGSFYNTSLAAQQSINLAGAATLVASTNALPDANWDTAYETQLIATGGTPLYSWSLDGTMPAGLTLATDGTISGKPATNGTFLLDVTVTDALGQADQAQVSLDISALDKQFVEAEAGNFVQANSSTKVGPDYQSAMQIAGGPTYIHEGYLRFDLSDIHTNDTFVQAQLELTVDGGSPAGSPIVLQVGLCSDSDDGWDETTLNYENRPAANGGISPVTATNLLVPNEKMVVDITDLVYATLVNDPSQKLTVRLFSETSTGWGDWALIADRHATSLASPRLIVQTTGAEGYEPPPPPPASASFTADPVEGDAPLTVVFDDSSGGTITNRVWDFGDGTILATTNLAPEHTYTTAGVYTVSLTVYGETNNSTQTQTDLITVTEPPPVNQVDVAGDGADCYIGLNSSYTPTLGSTTKDPLSVGDDNFTYNQGECCTILVFELPDPDGETVSLANLSITYECDHCKGVGTLPDEEDITLPKWVRLYGLRTASANTVLVSDYGYKDTVGAGDTLIQEDFIRFEESGAMDPVAGETDDDGDAALAAWIQAQYDAGAQPGDFIFLRAHAAFAYGNPVKISSAESATPPVLSLILGSGDEPVPPPPPPTVSKGGSGSFGRGQDVINWTTVQGSGYVYSVWFSTNLLEGFQPLETNLPDTVQSITNAISAPSVFYKIEAQ